MPGEHDAGKVADSERSMLTLGDVRAILRIWDAKDAELQRVTAERDAAAERARQYHADRAALWDALVPRGPFCRGCADVDGRCPDLNRPCDPQEAALEAARRAAAPSAGESVREVVDHHLKALAVLRTMLDRAGLHGGVRVADEMRERATALLTAERSPQPVGEELKPCAVDYEEAGDTELLLADVPTVAREVAPGVSLLLTMKDRLLIGVRVHSSIALAAIRQPANLRAPR